MGLIDGNILFMQLPDFAPLLVITKGTWGHQDGINQILPGPGDAIRCQTFGVVLLSALSHIPTRSVAANTFTFFTGSSDGKMHGFQIKSDLVAAQQQQNGGNGSNW